MHRFFQKKMKIFFTYIIVLTLLFSPMMNAIVLAEEPEEMVEEEAAEYVSDEIIVVYDDAGVSEKKAVSIQQEIEKEFQEQQIEIKDTLEEATEELGTVVLAKLPDEMEVEEAVEEIDNQEYVQYVQPNFEYHLMEEETSELETFSAEKKEYYLNNAHILEAWNEVKTQKQVTVAVFDTGCRMEHEDLYENINRSLAYDVLKKKLLWDRRSEFAYGDGDGHGTHVAGIVGAQADNAVGIEGTSYNAEILPIKICDDEGRGMTTTTLYQAFQYCVAHFDEINNLKVINLSIGDYSNQWDPLLEEMIHKLKTQYGVLCVCSGGNGNIDGTPRTDTCLPGDFADTLSVTALKQDGTDCVWSDYNENKDISAPGENIRSTTRNGISTYGTKSGTSMATPIVSGICALIWTKYPNLTVDEMVAVIKNSADPIPNQIEERKNKSGSAGAVNAKAALDLAKQIYSQEGSSKSLEKAEIIMPNTTYEYTGGLIKPEPTVKLDGAALEKNIDYICIYSNNVNAGTDATVCVRGIGKYSGEKNQKFTILPVKLMVTNQYQITKSGNSDFDYTGRPITPSFTFKRKAVGSSGSGVVLIQNQDYTISYKDNIEKGKATVIITGKGNYAAKDSSGNINSVKGYFNIYGNLGKCVGSYNKNVVYTGKEVFPNITIKDGQKVLVQNVDYILNGVAHKNIGIATVTATGVGLYRGSLTGNYNIVPQGTAVSSLSKLSKGFKVKWKQQSVQTTGYQIQYSLYSDFSKAKTVTVSKNTTVSKTIKKLKKKKYYYVRMRTYKSVNGYKYYSSWSARKRVKTK